MFFLLQIAILIVSTRHIYKTAKSTGHNAAVWASMNAIFFLMVPIFFVALAAAGLGVAATADLVTAGTARVLVILANFAGLGFAILAVILIMRHVRTINQSERFEHPPAPDFFEFK
jgi:Ni/Fe-hydrogenase subunit HybB-like protein